jgi:hypothetical protein
MSSGEGMELFAQLSCAAVTVVTVLQQLTHLSLLWQEVNYDGLSSEDSDGPSADTRLSQLSKLVNLQHLTLERLPDGGVPGGLPSQLVRLTCLNAEYERG